MLSAPTESEVSTVFTDEVIRKLHDVGHYGELFLTALADAADDLLEIFPREELFEKYSKYIFNYILSGFSEEARTIMANMKSTTKPYRRVFNKVKKVQKLLQKSTRLEDR